MLRHGSNGKLVGALPSPAMVVACVALIIAVGGTSYAAIKLPANSVGAKQLKKGAVERSKIKNGAIDATKLAPNTISRVPSAAQADHSAGSASLDKITYKSADGTIPAATNTSPGQATLDVNCDPGLHPLGGGIRLGDLFNELILEAQLNPAGYEFRVLNFDTTGAHTFTGTVSCVPAATFG